MLQLGKEAFDQVALTIEPLAEARLPAPVAFGLDIGCGTLVLDELADSVGIVGLVRQHDVRGPRWSSSVSAICPSCAWPAVRPSRIGSPCASTTTWILVVSPPRDQVVSAHPDVESDMRPAGKISRRKRRLDQRNSDDAMPTKLGFLIARDPTKNLALTIGYARQIHICKVDRLLTSICVVGGSPVYIHKRVHRVDLLRS